MRIYIGQPVDLRIEPRFDDKGVIDPEHSGRTVHLKAGWNEVDDEVANHPYIKAHTNLAAHPSMASFRPGAGAAMPPDPSEVSAKLARGELEMLPGERVHDARPDAALQTEMYGRNPNADPDAARSVPLPGTTGGIMQPGAPTLPAADTTAVRPVSGPANGIAADADAQRSEAEQIEQKRLADVEAQRVEAAQADAVKSRSKK